MQYIWIKVQLHITYAEILVVFITYNLYVLAMSIVNYSTFGGNMV